MKHLDIEKVNAKPILHFDPHQNRLIHPAAAVRIGFYQARMKRLLDIILVIAFAPLTVPLVLFLALIVRLDGGSAFFGHERIGREGRTFKCWKLRTMLPDSQAILARHLVTNAEAAGEWTRNFKLKADPRITRLGRFLRSSSLDELPQLWNVLLGQMAIVGPRPVTHAELLRYGNHSQAFLSVRPGITGNWQVNGRNDVSYCYRVKLDMDYIASVSLARDFGLIIRTLDAVLKRTGV